MLRDPGWKAIAGVLDGLLRRDLVTFISSTVGEGSDEPRRLATSPMPLKAIGSQ